MPFVPPLRSVSPGRRATVLALAGLAGLILCAYAAVVLTGFPYAQRVTLSQWTIACVELIATSLFVLRAVWLAEERAPWAVLGVAGALTLSGWLVSWQVTDVLDPQLSPSIADILWLSG